MNVDAASLDNLQDIVEPAAVSWWPMAIGWWVLLLLLLFIAMVVGCRRWRVWKAAAYRRAALRELNAAESSAEVSEILKRTALVAYPRETVAALSGDRWYDWLIATAGISAVDLVRRSLTQGVFGAAAQSAPEDLRQFAAEWIRTHHGLSDAPDAEGGR